MKTDSMKGMGKKAVFLDLDGTLLADDKSIPPVNIQAIEKARSRGNCIVISTGRPLKSAVGLAEDLGLTGEGNYLIAYNGGMLYDTFNRKVIFESSIALDTVRNIFRHAHEKKLHLQTYDRENVLVLPEGDDEDIRIYCRKIRMEYRVLSSANCITEEPVKMLAINRTDPVALEEFIDWINVNYGDSLAAFYSNPTYVEIVNKGLNKGNALRQLAQVLDIDISDTIAAGDQANDIDMIRAAGTGCAVSNATDPVKAAADYITEKDNNSGAVAEIIEKFVL